MYRVKDVPNLSMLNGGRRWQHLPKIELTAQLFPQYEKIHYHGDFAPDQYNTLEMIPIKCICVFVIANALANILIITCRTSQMGYLREENLRLHASYGAKITKIQTPWYILLDYFITRPYLKNSNVPFRMKIWL